MAESAKYAGYVRRDTPIDWSQVASDVVDKLGDIQKDKAAFREKNDKLAADAMATVGKYEAGQNPQLNQMAYDMIADGRSTISALHDKLKRREISPDAYNRALMSMTQQNDSFKDVISTYNTDLDTLNKGLADGTLGSGSAWVANKLSNLADLRDKKFQWVPDRNGMTNLYVTSVDEDGNMVKEPMSINSVKDLGKTEFKKYDLEGNINKLVKGMQTYTDPSGRIKDVRENPKYEEAKQATIKVAVTGDDQALSILTDYGDYTIYGEGQEVPEKGVKMVLNRNGVYVPEITPELTEAAKKIVDDSIEGRVGKIVTPYTPRRGDDKDPSGYSKNQIQTFETAHDIVWTAATGESFDGMNLTNYDFDIVKDGIQVYKKDGGKKRPIGKPLEIGTEGTARALSKYTKEFGTSAQQTKFDIIQKRRGTKGSDLEIIGEDVEAKAYTPSAQETNLLLTADDSIFNTVDRDDDEDSVLESKAKIEEFIKLKAPKANVSFRTSSQKIGDKGDRYKETVILINGSPVRDESNQLLKIQHDKQEGFTKKDFLNIITKAINEARKTKRFIAQAPGETSTGVSPNDNVAQVRSR